MVDPPVTQRRREFLILLAVIVSMTVNQTSIVIISPLAVAIADEFDTTVSLVGQLRTVSAVVSATLAPFVGLVSDRLGRRPIMSIGLASVAGFGLASALAPSFTVLLLIQIIGGVGVASLLSSGYAVAGDAFPPERRAWAVGIISIGQPMAWVVGLPVIGIVADSFGWRWSFVAVPVLFSLVGAVFLRWIPANSSSESGHGRRPGPLAGLGDILRNRSARSWIFTELLAYSGWAGTLVYLGAYYIIEHGRSTTATSVLLALTALCFSAGSLLSHRVASRFGSRATIVSGATLSAIALILTMILSPGLVLSLVLLMAFGLMQGVRGASASVIGMLQAPEHQGTMMGFRASVVQLGYVVGGSTGGVLLSLGGYSVLAIVFGAVIFAAAFAMASTVKFTGRGHVA